MKLNQPLTETEKYESIVRQHQHLLHEPRLSDQDEESDDQELNFIADPTPGPERPKRLKTIVQN